MSAITIFLCFLAATAINADDDLNIISRAQWGAQAAQGEIQSLAELPVPNVIIHHSDIAARCSTQATCQSLVRSIQSSQIIDQKLADIGANFLVGEDGNVYEGRGWNNAGELVSSLNNKSIAIVIIGNFEKRVPEAAAVNAVQKLISLGVSQNKIKQDYVLIGHNQAEQTTCPGAKLSQLIQSWPHWSPNPA